MLRRWPGGAAVVIVDRDGPVTTAGPVGRPYPLASVTKLFTATAVLVAVEEGSLALDSPAGPPGATVAHLLAHASGLGPHGEVLSPPSRRRIYSNAGYEVVAETLTAATGIGFTTYATEAIVHPLRLDATDLTGSPAHGASASALDVATLARAWMVPGLLLAESTLQVASTPFEGDLAGVLPGFGSHDPNPWGLGPEIRGAKSPHWTGARNSPRTFGHFGRSGTLCWIDPALGHGLVALGDEAFGPWARELWPVLADVVISRVVDG